jgi:hypothetical protein
MLVVDGALLSDDAVMFLLPSLALHVLSGAVASSDLLLMRLQRVAIEMLTAAERVLIADLIRALEEFEWGTLDGAV